MSVIPLLILAGGLVAAAFLGAFIWAVRTGQFDDTVTPPVRIVVDDAASRAPHAAPRTPNAGPRTPDSELRTPNSGLRTPNPGLRTPNP